MSLRIRLAEERLQELDELALISHSHQRTIQKLQEWGLLKKDHQFICDKLHCEKYQQYMTWFNDYSIADLGRYRCTKCNTSNSLRIDSIFYQSKLRLNQLFRIIFINFVRGSTIKMTSVELGLSRLTVSQLYKWVRSQIFQFNQNEINAMPLGITPKVEIDESDPLQPITYNQPVVEVDESLFTHFRQVQNRTSSQIWVMGGVDRATGDFRVSAIGNERSTQVQKRFFRQHIATNPVFQATKTRVFTDGHRSYNFLQGEGYDHQVVIHDRGFGRGINTTNHIESLWSQFKHFQQFNSDQSYSSVEAVQEALEEISFRIRCNRQSINISQQLSNIIIYNQQSNQIEQQDNQMELEIQ